MVIKVSVIHPLTVPVCLKMASKRLSGSQYRKRRRAKFLAARVAYVADNPTPYERYADEQAVWMACIRNALGDAPLPAWQSHRDRPPTPLTIADLAIGAFAVERVGSKGITYGQLSKCFSVVTGRGCHRSKASAIFAALLAHQVIRKLGNYSAGRKGNLYAIDHTPKDDDGDWLAMPGR